LSASRSARDDATRISYAVCFTPRALSSLEASNQLNLGFDTSIPSGSILYSQRSFVAVSTDALAGAPLSANTMAIVKSLFMTLTPK
jgi:hypothetical protein